jgi:hypothetical protein
MDIKKQLVSVSGVQVQAVVAAAFTSLQQNVQANKSGQTISIKSNGGYMSSYDVLRELVEKVDVDVVTNAKLKQQILKARESYESFVSVATGANAKLFEQNINSLEKKHFLSSGEPYAYAEEVIGNDHLFLQEGTKIYGIPNKTTLDPRRTGIFIALNPISIDLYLYLKQIAPNYGFIWYGMSTTYWLYVGNVINK